LNFLDLAKNRYSVRAYLDKPVDEDLVMKIMEAVRFAPSACNNQPLSFIVIRDKDSRKKLETVYSRDWFLNAPCIIAVCFDKKLSWKRGDGKEYGEVDAAIAMDHLTLAATELGLGTCWIGAFKADAARAVLMLPENIEPVAFTPLGYPAASKVTKNRKDFDQLIHWEFYGGKHR
jgi:nitroreductase